MLVEDDASARDVIRRQLEMLEWDVVAFGSGEDAVRAISSGLRVTLVLADVHLPGMTGIAAAHAVAALSPGTHIALMSGAAPLPASIRPETFLRKPFTVASLSKAIAAATGSAEPGP
jgi:CheY-like chemotaxis protein